MIDIDINIDNDMYININNNISIDTNIDTRVDIDLVIAHAGLVPNKYEMKQLLCTHTRHLQQIRRWQETASCLNPYNNVTCEVSKNAVNNAGCNY